MGRSKRRDYMRFCLLLHLTIAAIFTQCDASRQLHPMKGSSRSKSIVVEIGKKLKALKNLDGVPYLPAPTTDPYVSSPFSIPPYDSLSPVYYPDQNATQYCTTPPSTTIPTPIGFGYTPTPLVDPGQGPPSSPSGTMPSPTDSSTTPNPPDQAIPSPTGGGLPGTPASIPIPPYFEPSPPTTVPSPSTDIPSPTGFMPSPPVFLPPIVYPPPLGPPSAPKVGPGLGALWCVAKPSVPDPIIQEAMDYACGSGADCDSIQPSGPCFEPNTLFAHASFAFNSYWQRTKVAGGTCSFGGTAMLVTIDPSYNGCHFMLV